MTLSNKKLRFATRAIHAGQEPEVTTGAIMTPIYASSTYVQQSPGEHKGFEYSRTSNPTRLALENCIADLEEGHFGFAFASGMAAISTVLELLDHGSHIIASDDLYGGSRRLLTRVRNRTADIQVSFANLADLDSLRNAITAKTKMIWVETPTNPMMQLADLSAIADIAREHKLISVCDNTFATPMAQLPLRHGFNMVVHSATKYINGHSDALAGLVVCDEQHGEALGFLQNSVGGILSPFDSFLVLRGIKTLPIRMQRHSENATAVAAFLEKHNKVNKVYYPGLSSHAQHSLAKKQMGQFGGILSVELKTDLEGTVNFLKQLYLFALAESLGGVESLIEHPAIMTHASVPAAVRQDIGISDSLIRISVGIEDVDDLIAELAAGLMTIT